MPNQLKGIYAQNAPLYLEKGILTLPVEPGSKACKLPGWQNFAEDKQWQAKVSAWVKKYPEHGIAVPLGFGTRDDLVLACVDVDDDSYIAPILAFFAAGCPLVRKRGKKGTTIFCQAPKGLGNASYCVEGTNQKAVVELFTNKKITVIPPSIHPGTDAPYQWEGSSLLDIDLTTLPVIGKPN